MFELYDIIGFDLDDTLFERFTSIPLVATDRLLDAAKGKHIFIATNQAGPVWHRVVRDYQTWSRRSYPTVGQLAHNIIAMCDEFPVLKDAPWYISMGDERAIKIIDDEESKRNNFPGINVLSGQQITANIAAELQVILFEAGITKAQVTFSLEDRKPKPGMLTMAMKDFKASVFTKGIIIPGDMKHMLYVGDRSGGYNNDEQAAVAAGCAYLDITDAEKQLGIRPPVVYEEEEITDHPF